MKRILLGATLIVAGVIGVAGASPVAAEDHDDVPVQVDDKVCQPQDSHLAPTGPDKTTQTVTAPDGKLISQFCVKSGSINNDLGPHYVDVIPPAKTVTITYTKTTDVKDISHYVLFYVEAVTPAKPPSEKPTCLAPGTVERLADTDSYTYKYEVDTPTAGVTTVTVVARAEYGFVGDSGPWTYPIAQLTGEQCDDDPIVESNPPPATPAAPAAPTDRPPVLASPAVASAGPVPAQPALTALPATGTASWALALIAMGLVLLGSGFVGFSRRLS